MALSNGCAPDATPSAREGALLYQIESADADLTRWDHRGRTMPPEQPERGSELADDDRVFPAFPVSEVARYSLLSAGEHLRLARLAIEARHLFPSAHSTVLRGALVGAAQGVWILAPESRAERQQRGLTVVAELYRQNAAYDREVLKAPQGDRGRADAQASLEYVNRRAAQVQTARTSSSRLSLTDVVGAALDDAFAEAAKRQAGRELWRSLSGDAHVLVWPALSRGRVTGVDKTTGMGVVASDGQLAQIAEPYLCAHRMLKHGWSLFDRRCEGT